MKVLISAMCICTLAVLLVLSLSVLLPSPAAAESCSILCNNGTSCSANCGMLACSADCSPNASCACWERNRGF